MTLPKRMERRIKNMGPLMLVVGTRPEIIKLAPVIKGLQKVNLDYVFVWTGQHYDYELSKIFFEQFKIPEPDEDLNIGSGTNAEQVAKCMLGLEKLIGKYAPSVIVAEGDTNSVVASSIVAAKCLTPFAHVEAGLRSWNPLMPEEINRRLAGTVATLHFAPTLLAAINLAFEGIPYHRVHITGNTIVDVIYEYKSMVKKIEDKVLAEFNLDSGKYILVTLHRVENTENRYRLEQILRSIKKLSSHYPVVFPMHPRTRNAITRWGLSSYLDLDRIKLTKPVGYFEFLALLANCRVVLTDSGGVQEEAFTLKVPTVTLRYNTERPETTMFGINILAGAEEERILKSSLIQIERFDEIRKLNFKNPLGDGKAGERIVKLLKENVDNEITLKEPDLRDTPLITYLLLDGMKKLDETAFLDLIVGFRKNGKPTFSFKGSKLLARVRKKLYDKGASYP